MEDLKNLTVEALKKELGKEKIDSHIVDALTRLLETVKWKI